MGVDYYNCDFCNEIFSLSGASCHCDNGHYFCGHCSDKVWLVGYASKCIRCDKEDITTCSEEGCTNSKCLQVNINQNYLDGFRKSIGWCCKHVEYFEKSDWCDNCIQTTNNQLM